MKGALWRHLKNLRKNLTKQKYHAQKIFGQGETRTHVLLHGRPQKILINLYAQLTLVWQLKEASL